MSLKISHHLLVQRLIARVCHRWNHVLSALLSSDHLDRLLLELWLNGLHVARRRYLLQLLTFRVYNRVGLDGGISYDIGPCDFLLRARCLVPREWSFTPADRTIRNVWWRRVGRVPRPLVGSRLMGSESYLSVLLPLNDAWWHPRLLLLLLYLLMIIVEAVAWVGVGAEHRGRFILYQRSFCVHLWFWMGTEVRIPATKPSHRLQHNRGHLPPLRSWNIARCYRAFCEVFIAIIVFRCFLLLHFFLFVRPCIHLCHTWARALLFDQEWAELVQIECGLWWHL